MYTPGNRTLIGHDRIASLCLRILMVQLGIILVTNTFYVRVKS